jgi:NitT/TauT family transport system ATP-binding protein
LKSTRFDGGLVRNGKDSDLDSKTPPLITVKNARKRFVQGNGKSIAAIEDLSFEIASGEYVAIVGPTGAGKSVLLDCLTGLKTLDRGQIAIGKESVAQYLSRRNGRITRIFQEDRLLPWLSALDNAALGLELQGVAEKERREMAGHWLKAVGLSEHMNAYPHELSGGMRQRVNIARAFAPSPEIVLLDEAFSALDEITATRLREDFKKVAQAEKMTYLIVTHSLDEAIFLADRILVFGAPARLMAEVAVADQAWENKTVRNELRDTLHEWILKGSRKQ